MCCQGLCIPQYISLSDARKNAPKRALPTRYAGYARTTLGRSPDFPAVLTAPLAYLRLFLVKLATVVKLVSTVVYRKPSGKAPVIDPGNEPPCRFGGWEWGHGSYLLGA
jgi:hypothetical protein